MDDLRALKDEVDEKLPLTGAPNRVKVANHNPLTKDLIDKLGRNTGFPYTAKRSPTAGIVQLGCIYWNGNALNNIDNFNIFMNSTTMDGNSIAHIFGVISKGAIIKFKDFAGRTTLLEYQTATVDEEQGHFIVTVRGFPENTNYVYQEGEQETCFIEFIGGSKSEVDPFIGVELNLSWGKRGDKDEDQQEGVYYRNLDRPVYYRLYSDIAGSEIWYEGVIPLRISMLCINIENFDKLDGKNPKLILEKYSRKNRRAGNSNGFCVQAGYKRQQSSSDAQIADDPHDGAIIHVPRPTVFDITAQFGIYDLVPENYFSFYNFPLTPKKKLNAQYRNKEQGDLQVSAVNNPSDTRINKKPLYGKGFIYLRLRIEIDGDNGRIKSKPLQYLRIEGQTYGVGSIVDHRKIYGNIDFSYQ